MSDRSLRALEVLGRSDPDFAAVTTMLYGTVDPDELLDVVYKAMPDQADLSAPGADPAAIRRAELKERKRKEKLQARVGLASNVVGLTAGTAALAGAAANPALRAKTKQLGQEHIKPPMEPKQVGGPVTGRVARAFKAPTTRGRLIRAGAIGALGLQAANIGGDVIANRVLSRSASGPKRRTKPPVEPTAKIDLTGVGTAFAGGLKGKGGAFGKAPKAKMGWTTSQGAGSTVSSYGPLPGRAAKQPKARRSYVARTGRKAPAPAVVTPTKPAPVSPKQEGKVFEQPKMDKDAVRGAPKEAKPLTTGQKVGLGGAALGVPYLLGRSSGSQSDYGYYGKRDSTTVEWEGTFAKLDTDKRLAFGWASVTKLNGMPVVDRQGDWITDDDLEDAAYTYVVKSRKGGDMHRRDGDQPFHAADLVESFVLTHEKAQQMGLPDSTPLGWWVGFRINDEDAWQAVKKRERTGFSIHGSGRRREVSYDAVMAGG